MKKTLKISEETHEKLKQEGKKGETFDEIIKRLLPPETRKERKKRSRKLEDLAKIARERKKKEIKSGKIQKDGNKYKVKFSDD